MSPPSSRVRQEAHEWRARIDDGLSESEKSEFRSWMASSPAHGEAYAEAELIWHALGSTLVADVVKSQQPAEATARSGPTAAPSWLGALHAAGMAVAATVAIFVAVAFFDNSNVDIDSPPLVQAASHQTELGEVKELRLDDGSQVVMGPKSRIKVSSGPDFRRIELLSGSAFFDVVSDSTRPFMVRAGAAEVLVTGTAFDLQLKPSGLYVAVGEGAVELSHPLVLRNSANADNLNGWQRRPGDVIQKVDLTAGQAASANRVDGIGPTHAVDPEQIGAWRAGQLIYFRASLAEIAADLNRYRARPLVLEADVESLRLSGTFKVNEIDEMLETLELALPIRVVSGPEKDRIVRDR